MPFTYAGINTYHASSTLPSDGDPAIAESVNVVLEALLDNSVYLRTELTFHAFDVRGKTSNITGPIVLNDAGGSVAWNIAQEMNRDVDIHAELAIHSDGDFACAANNARFTGDLLTVGTTGTDQFTVNSDADFNDRAQFHGVVDCDSAVTISGATAELTVNGPVVLLGGDLQFGQPGQPFTTTISNPLSVGGEATFFADTRIKASTHLGINASDTHLLTGDVTCENALSVGGDTSIGGNLVVSGGAGDNEIHDDTTFFSDVAMRNDVEIGSSSTDSLTINANLITPLTFAGSGRFILRPSQGPDAAGTSVSVTTTNCVYIPFAWLSAPRTYTLLDGSVIGDEILFTSQDSTQLLTISPNSGSPVGIKPSVFGLVSWVRYMWTGSLWFAIERNQD